MTQPTRKTENLDIDMQPVGRRVDVTPGTTLLEADRESGDGLVSLCRGEGWCVCCLVGVAIGVVNSPTQSELDYLSAEDLEAGYRLVCQVASQTDVHIDIPVESLSTPRREQIEGKDLEIPLAPNLDVVDLDISPPTIQPLRADAERLIGALAEKGQYVPGHRPRAFPPGWRCGRDGCHASVNLQQTPQFNQRCDYER